MEENGYSQTNETMADYADELEASFKRIEEGDILTGTVISVSDTAVILDLKYYAEGIIPAENLSNDPNFLVKEEIHIGDTLSATVVRKDDGEGNILLSRKEAADILAWDKLKNLLDTKAVVKVKINGIVNSGATAYLEGIRGFIPVSKLDSKHVDNLEEWLNKEVDVQVITVDESAKKLILSAREVALERAAQENNVRISKVSVGSILEGTVDSIKEYGAFIVLENGLSGLLHISQISEKRIKSPAAILKVGQKVTVKIISNDNNKISLSMKALTDVAEKSVDDEVFEYNNSESVSTGLGDLLSKLKF